LVPDKVNTDLMHVGIGKNFPDLCEKIGDIINEINKNGTLDAIKKKYYASINPYLPPPINHSDPADYSSYTVVDMDTLSSISATTVRRFIKNG
jgi:LysM repeat protein